MRTSANKSLGSKNRDEERRTTSLPYSGGAFISCVLR
jgi:hypothetical protein